jgi:hypothetical protein
LTVLSVVQSMLLLFGAADTACAESGRDYQDAAVVLQVVRNRAELWRKGWRRYDGSLWGALWSPQQHAHGCRWPITADHLQLGWQFITDTLDVPPWAKKALYYCGRWDAPGACEARGGRVWLGQLAHEYWR